MKYVVYFAIGWCVMLAVAGEALVAQRSLPIFSVTGKLLRCDVDAARESLQPGGTQSQEHTDTGTGAKALLMEC